MASVYPFQVLKGHLRVSRTFLNSPLNMSERELYLCHTHTVELQQHDTIDMCLTKDFLLVMNFAEKSVPFYLSWVLTSFSEIAIWLHNAGTELEDLLGTNSELSFR